MQATPAEGIPFKELTGGPLSQALQAFLPDRFDSSAPYIEGALIALGIFILGWLISKWVQRLVLKVLRKNGVDEALTGFLASMAQWIVIAAAAIAAMDKAGLPATSLLALLGAAGLAVGLALQGTLSNFAAGVMILLFRPFTIGHRVKIDGETGAVKEVGLFATTLSTPDKDTIIIPNSQVTSGTITNYSSEGKYRANVDIGVAYGVDVAHAMDVIQKALVNTDLVLDEPAPDVAFAGFGASSLDFVARGWCLPDDLPSMSHNARVSIYNALEAAGIEIPYDQVVIHNAPAS